MITAQFSRKLESVRGIAAFLVLLAHTYEWFLFPLLGNKHISATVLILLSHFSVLVFFALSGYVITNSLISNYRRNGQIDSASFAIARLARIVPPAFAACVFSLLVALLIIGAGWHGSDTFRTVSDLSLSRERISLSAPDILATFLLSNGILPGTSPIITNGPLWSLSIEFWAYFLALIGASAIAARRGVGLVNRSLSVPLTLGFFMLIAIFCACPLTVMQFLLYWFVGSVLFLRKRYPAFAKIALIILLLAATSSVCFSVFTARSINLVSLNGSAGFLAIPIKAAILVGMAFLVPLVNFFPFHHFFCGLAKSSYTLYIFHFPILCLLFSFFHLPFLRWGVGERAAFLAFVIFSILLICHLLALYLEDKKYWQTRLQLLIAFGRKAAAKRQLSTIEY